VVCGLLPGWLTKAIGEWRGLRSCGEDEEEEEDDDDDIVLPSSVVWGKSSRLMLLLVPLINRPRAISNTSLFDQPRSRSAIFITVDSDLRSGGELLLSGDGLALSEVSICTGGGPG